MKSNTAKRSAAAFLAAVMMLCTACSSSESSSKSESSSAEETSASTTAVTTTTPEETTTTTTTTAPLMPPMTQAAEYFKGFEENLMIRRFYSGADNTLLVQCGESDGEKNYIYVFDPISNSVIRTQALDSFSEDTIGMFADGTIVTYDYTMNGLELHYYRSGSSKPDVINAGDDCIPEYRVDTENNCFYWFEYGDAYINKVDSKGETTKLDINENICSISELRPEEGVFFAREYDDQTDTGYSQGVFSLETGEILFSAADGDTDQFYCDGCYMNIGCDFSDETKSIQFIDKYPADNSGKITRYTFENEHDTYYSFRGSSNSRYTAITWFDYSSSGLLKSLAFLDPETSKMACVELDKDKGIDQVMLVYMKDLNRWIAALNYPTDAGYSCSLMMIDPSLLDYKTDIPNEQIDKPKNEPITVGESYKKVRELADEVEKEFGIKLLVGNEVKISEKTSQYKFASCEEENDKYVTEMDINALEELKKILGKYPEGFFDHFKTQNGKFGLRISLVSKLTNDEFQEFTAAGIAFTSGMWYDIAIGSIYVSSADSSLDHELWHCVENLLNTKYPLNDEEWNALNPADFNYTNDFEGYITTYDEGDYILGYYDDSDTSVNFDAPYFVSQYSIVTPMEDRATLIQRVFEPMTDYDTMEIYTFGSKRINKFPHLKAKLDHLAEWSKKEFGYVYWEEILKNIK